MFNAKSFVAAMENPVFVDLDGITTTGIPLSHPQYHKVLADLDAATTREETQKVMHAALTQMQLPADHILNLPEPAFQVAIADFFRCCRGEKAPSAPATP